MSLIANVLEPKQGVVLDPACGSGGMFVQSAHFVERMKANPSERLTFYGLEKNPTTIRLAKMNLAVHGLEGNIQKAITYYEDPHELLGKADFVLANPPFNVDEVDADKVKRDPRLPFGLPGVNKKGRVSNGNYLWISYFYSYLNDKGRAGFVMSSQASSAGRDEGKVRQKLIESGHVDIMIAIRSNFFYTRTVPCELWFIDRGKPDQPSPPAPLPRGEGSHYRGGFDFSGLVKRARELRDKQTPAEELFWQLVRNRRFLGLKFRRQHQFGDYILDFYCHDQRLAIEFDGGVHKTRKKMDSKRDAYLASQNIRVVRVPNQEILANTNHTLEKIAVEIRSASPRPLGEDTGEGRFSAPYNCKGRILMIDARNIYRKVTRKIYDFSPEQRQNVLAIIWLYRGQSERFLDLVARYLERALNEAGACFEIQKEGTSIRPLPDYKRSLGELMKALQPFLATQPKDGANAEVLNQFREGTKTFGEDISTFRTSVEKEQDRWKKQKRTNAALNEMTERLARMAESSRDLIKQTDLLYKLASRLIETCESESNAKASHFWVSRDVTRTRKAADEARQQAVEQLKQVRYFWRQAHWLTERFPEGKLRDVEGLVKLVDRAEIEKNDWSLTPGRYVGVAPEEEDENFDFEEALRDIHVELEDLNTEAVKLAKKIKNNFEELGV